MRNFLLCTASVLIAFVAIACGFLFVSQFYRQSIAALASCDVELVFVVMDADSGEPLQGAVVDIWIEELDRTKKNHDEKLITGKDGKARLFRRDNCCEDFITGSRIRRTDYDLTWCSVQKVTAKGHAPADIDALYGGTLNLPRTVTATRDEPRFSELRVDIWLRKVAAKGEGP